ncbi:hypothetical protein GCM10009558_090170 [Virgisporangium aurantiacum]
MLGQVGRQQVDGDPPLRPGLAGVDDGRAHPVARLRQSRVGQAGEDQRRQPLGHVGLDDDHLAHHPDQGDRPDLCITHAIASLRSAMHSRALR